MGKYALVHFFLPVRRFSPVSIIPLMLRTHSFIYQWAYVVSAIDVILK
jgi:hypothetical protein